MRNLKRALSLALASVMLLGMMVVGTSASYADVSSENNQEAIEVLQAAGIMTGDENGNFNPDKTVTRNEMAVVMANMLDLDYNYYKGTNPFSDVPEWAAPYVAACFSEGIVAGTSATTFGGNATVTASQAALMMLKALGYFKYQPDFEDDWQLATIRQANKIDLFDDIDANANTALTRNQVAQLALNALESNMVEWSGTLGTNITTTDGTEINVGYVAYYNPYGSSKDYTPNATPTGDGYLQLVEELFDEDLKKYDTTDDFGRSANKWTYKAKEVGTYSEKADAVYANKVTKATMYDLVGKDVVDDILDARETAADLTVVVDGETIVSNSKTAADVGYFFDKKNTASIGNGSVPGNLTGNGTSTEVYIDDDNNAVEIVIINTYLIQATDDYNEKTETVKTATVGNVVAPVAATELTISSDDFAVEKVAEDDYLLITCAGARATGKEIKSVAPATVLTGNVEKYSLSDSVVIDGTTYKYAFKADTTSTNGKAVAYDIGEDTTVVTDGTFILYVDEASVTADKYVYVAEIATTGDFASSNDLVAKAYFLDGTTKSISIKDKYSDDSAVRTATPNTWFTYTVNNSGKYTLGKLTAGGAENNTGSTTTITTNGTVLVENGKINVNGGAIKANSSTIFVVIDDDDEVAAYTGIANVPTVKVKNNTAITASYVVAKNTSYAKYVFIDASDASFDSATSSSSDFIYLLKYDSTGKDAAKNDYYVYKAIVNGEETKISLNDNFSARETVYTLYTDVKYDADGYVDSMNIVDSNDDYVQVATVMSGDTVDYEDGVLSIGAYDVVVGNECEIYLIAADSNVKEDAGTTYEVSSGISANTLYNQLKGYAVSGTYFAQVDDDTDTLTALYIYVSATV